jgi:hypothetical protein
MGAPALENGQLPMGRWVCSMAEVEAAFVPHDPADPRRVIWDQWTHFTRALQGIVGEVAACWLSGSLFSNKPVPGDIDCLYIVDTDRLTAVSQSGDLTKIWFVFAATTGRAKTVFGVPVDSYVLEWTPTPGPDRPVGARAYFEDRGYWDDLWVRVKDADKRLDSIPRRGYLEVIIDGYR